MVLARGQLGLHDGLTTPLPLHSAIEHPYIAGRDEDDTLALHVGQTVTLTILMHPTGKATLTSGALPRKALALARDAGVSTLVVQQVLPPLLVHGLVERTPVGWRLTPLGAGRPAR